MSDKRIFILKPVQHPSRKLAAAQCELMPDDTMVIFDPEPSKTREQEAMYHAIFGEIAKQCSHLNRAFDREGWKRLLLDQFQRDMLNDPTCDEDVRNDLKAAVMMVPSLDGCSIVSIGLQSRKFKKKTASAFIDWLDTWRGQGEFKA